MRRSSLAASWSSQRLFSRRVTIRLRCLGGPGRSGKKSNKSISSFPWTSRTGRGLLGCGGAAMPRSRGAGAVGCVTRACASGAPFGVAAIPRSRGTARCFLIITRGGIAYTLPTSRRDHSRYAEEEYGSTGQEKNQGEPQAQRISRARIGRPQARGIAQIECVAQIDWVAQVGSVA